MGLLAGLRSPRDLKALPAEQMADLAGEIRAFLVAKVTKTGGHLGPNLGVVELTIALHRVFDSPRDVLIFDTGHQTYVHKILTGRAAGFDSLKAKDGLSGYPNRAESEHDVVENSHASTALSYADGVAKAFELQRVSGRRRVVAVIGDGALTGGMAWEALNNIAAARERPLVIVVNDNERSYSPTVGGVAHHLATLRTTKGYERFLDWGKATLGRTPVVGPPLYETLHGVKKGLKDIIAPQGMFEDLGLKYVGPVDGHDEPAIERALQQAAAYGGPVIVHVITEKGHGYPPAVRDDAERFHAVGVIDAATGRPLGARSPSWTSVFGDEIVRIGRERSDVVAITAAMQGPTGLDAFAAEFPDRTFDVGIAEQHAATSAAGMAYAGLHPVIALYATFLNRAFDQVLMDCALHHAAVTFVLDRAGVTGDDGPSHNGMWDLSLLQLVPGLAIGAPRDGAQLREMLREAVAISDGPSAVRYPKGAVPDDIPALSRIGGTDVLYRGRAEPGRASANGSAEHVGADVLIVSVGAMAGVALEVAHRLQDQGIRATVVDPRWVSPVDPALVELVAAHRLVVTVEDNGRTGGVGTTLAQVLRDHRVTTPVRDFGIPQQFLAHARPAEVKAEIGLTSQDISRAVVETVAGLDAHGSVAADAVRADGVAADDVADPAGPEGL
jgi:1-deoxy-D-xylulose-5-phosphate synthase